MKFAYILSFIFLILGALSVLKQTTFAFALSGSWFYLLFGAVLILLMYKAFASSWKPKIRRSDANELGDIPCWNCGDGLTLKATTCPACQASVGLVITDRLDIAARFPTLKNCICCLQTDAPVRAVRDRNNTVAATAHLCRSCKLRRKATRALDFVLIGAALLLALHVTDKMDVHWTLRLLTLIAMVSPVIAFTESRTWKFGHKHAPGCVSIGAISWQTFSDGSERYWLEFGNPLVAARLRHLLGPNAIAEARQLLQSDKEAKKKPREPQLKTIGDYVFRLTFFGFLLLLSSFLGTRISLHGETSSLALIVVALISSCVGLLGFVGLIWTIVQLQRTRAGKASPPSALSDQFAKAPPQSLSKARNASLHDAAHSGDLDRVKELMESGARVDQRSKSKGATALHYAVEAGFLSVATYLLSEGADVNASRNDDARGGRGNTALMMAAMTQGPSMIELLLRHGARVNEQNGEGASALFMCSQRGNAESATLLLKAGADPNLRTSTGAMPLHIAAERGHTEVAALLVEAGSRIDEPTHRNGDTPLHDASLYGHLAIVKFLLAKGADAKRSESLGNTPLHLASFGGFPKIVQALLDAGANPVAKNAEGFRPIELACRGDGANYSNQTNIVRMLSLKSF